MLTTNKITELLGKVSQLSKEYDSIEEIKLFGSQRLKLSDNSDVDILIIIKDNTDKQELLKTLCFLSLNYKILIHPVVLSENEFNMRKNIDLYKNNILKKSIVLFNKKGQLTSASTTTASSMRSY